jgi:hypothetical protein
MHRHEQVFAADQAKSRQRVRIPLGERGHGEAHVGHHVADEPCTPADALAFQVLHGSRRRAEAEVAHVVGQHAVSLLGHRPVEGPHAGLDVSEGDRDARARESAGQGRVRVP